jgi:succinoglycan biosynthesis transport protein ExoP
MKNSQPAEHSPGINLGDIYFVLFRHKWKIILCATAGILAAAVFYLVKLPPFQSEAELLIRYVLDSRSPNPTANNTRETLPTELGDSIINDEIRILTSFDLAEEVATNIGPEKILAKLGGGNDPMTAASVVQNGLKVEATSRSSVISIIFQSPDPTIVQPVLVEIINVYLEKHMQVHQAIGTSDDFLTEETAQLRSQIAETDAELFSAKTNAGIISIDDAEKSYSDQLARIRQELFQAEADLAERQATLNPDMTNAASVVTTVDAPAEQIEAYKKISQRLEFLKNREDDYLNKLGYTEENKLVKEVEGLITETTKQKKELEDKNPALVNVYVPSLDISTQETPAAGGSDRVLALRSRIIALRGQLNQIQTEAAAIGQAESKISDLERKKQIEEGNYQGFAKSLEQARIDEALGPGRVSNISSIQRPTPPFKDRSKRFKNMLVIIMGGILGGVAWAFLIEFYLDGSVKRPREIESRLKLPLFLSIPDLSQNGQKHLAQAAERRQLQFNGNGNGGGDPPAAGGDKLAVVSWDASSFLNPFYDALRDRLIVYFESINLTRKPKLVAVTSTDRGSGVSTIASGLAASLSETGDGRVLLVSMNQEGGAAQQFFRGKSACKLDDALESEKRDSALVQENLYVVNEGSNSEKLQRVLPRRFAALVPKLKASDYDYIIFDMPPVSQTSITSRLAGFMDMMLLVIESEKTDREMVQQATALLAQSKANVGAVLNKTRKYVPSRLHQESLGDA